VGGVGGWGVGVTTLTLPCLRLGGHRSQAGRVWQRFWVWTGLALSIHLCSCVRSSINFF
jgi:hypothetical protein